MSAETLRKAAAIVRERGLAKGRYEDDDHRVCAFGALAFAHFGQTDAESAESADVERDAHEAASEVGVPVWTFSHWNDLPGTTAEDVAAAFERAAAAIESQTDDDAGANPGAVPTR